MVVEPHTLTANIQLRLDTKWPLRVARKIDLTAKEHDRYDQIHEFAPEKASQMADYL